MTDTAALSAVLDYYVESYTKAYATVCDIMGISRAEYDEYYGYAEQYIDCVDSMAKYFTYTLQTRYTKAELSAMTIAEKEVAVYAVVYDTCYYMNELAKCIGIKLSDYDYNKSTAIPYIGDSNNLAANPGYINQLIERYAVGFADLGYTLEQAKALDPDDAEEIIRDIIREKDFAEYKTVDVELVGICKSYVDGVEVYSNMSAYCTNAAKELSSNYFFDAVVGHLNEQLQAKLEK